MSTHTSDRIILAEHPGWPVVSVLARQNGWQVVEDVPAGNPVNAPREIVLLVGPSSLEVHYCEDEATQISYVFAGAATQSGVQSLVSLLEDELPTISLPQLLADFDEGSGFDDRGSSLLRLTMAAPSTYDVRVFSRVQQAIQDQDERLRSLAVWATSYTPWPEYKELLRSVSKADSSVRIRGDAMRMLESFDAAGV